MWTLFLYLIIYLFLLAIRLQFPPFLKDWSWLYQSPITEILNFFVLMLTLYLGTSLLKIIYRKRKKLNAGEYDNVIVGLNNIYYILLTGAILISIPAFFGIDYIALFTSLSIVAAAIAIISKEFIQDIIGGIIISFSKEISIDDFVRIGEEKGKILDINIHKITLINEDDDVIYLPNYKVFTSNIINYTKKQIKKVNIGFEIDIAHLSSIEELEQSLANSIDEFHEFIEPNSFNIRIVEIQTEKLLLKFQFILLQINRDLEREIRKKTVRRIVQFIKDAEKPGI